MASSCPSAAKSSVSMTTSTKGIPESNQMQVKSPSSPQYLDQSVTFSSHSGHAFSGTNTNIHDQELIPPTSRLSRLPFTQPNISSTTGVAISASQTKTTHIHSGHDVHDSVNSSTSLSPSLVPRHFGPLPNSPETSVSNPSRLNVLTHPIRRPRTHNKVFQSSKDLAAHYGIPEILPPAPRTTTHQPANPPIQIDFQTLSSNYLSMLSQNPSDNTNMLDPVAPLAASQEELSAPVIPDDDDVLAAMLAPQSEWEMATPCLIDDYSPFSPYLNTPLDSTLDTPLVDYLDDQMLTGPDYIYNGSLFPGFAEWSTTEAVQEPVVQPKSLPELDVSALLTMSPSSPLLNSFVTPQQTTAPAPSVPSTDKSAAPRRRIAATGIRKGVTPDTLLDESAPTQSRNYVTPSVTSRKDVPAVFARKRARSTAFGDEEDQLDDYVLPPNPTEKDLIEQKRRQNTVAARRSRKRKLEHLQQLESSLEDERQQKEQWRQRALMLSSILSSLNQPVPDFSTEGS